MNSAARLHHCCQNISKGSLQDVIEMYELLNCKITYQPSYNAGWVMIGQDQLRFDIQITEVDDAPVEDISKKLQTHIAFISDEPQNIIDSVRLWAEKKGLKFREGGWSERERYFDLQDVFVNFVVEVMHSSIEEE